ncbi:MAG: serine/threonine-protein kinase, partial [Gemmataceae bacterium]
MSAVTTSTLLDAIRHYELLDDEQLAEVGRWRLTDLRQLAGELVRRGWLTTYQVNQLAQGKGADLALGSYVLLEPLGEGGMGEVFKAKHRTLNRVVALKLIRKERLANATAVKRFQREVKAAAQLIHPNIVHAFDADQVGDTHFLVMEYVVGADLNALVKKHGPLPVADACDYIRQAALGLQHAHEHGMVHRDIKPHNLLVGCGQSAVGRKDPAKKDSSLPMADRPRPTLKILDMGLARVARLDSGEDSSTLTKEGSVMGTLDYIAPEQAMDSHAVDIRADMYSLGCTFYFLLTGQVPFPGGDALAKLMKHKLEEPVPVEQLRPDVPAPVAAVVRKLMAKEPHDRYQTPAELAAALATLASGGRPSPGAV